MPGVVRLGDICTGHDGYPPRANIEGSPNVYVNGRPAHCQGHAWGIHCKKSCHGGSLASGSSTVYVNGRQLGYIGAPVDCGSSCATGSSDVFVGM